MPEPNKHDLVVKLDELDKLVRQRLQDSSIRFHERQVLEQLRLDIAKAVNGLYY